MATEVERLDLGHERSSVRAVVALPDGERSSWRSRTSTTRSRTRPSGRTQAATAAPVARGMAADQAAQIVVGDFNAEPGEPTYARMVEAGYRSAFATVHGSEGVTWPSGLQAPAMDTDGDPGCLDYVWVRGAVRVLAARLVFDRPAVG